MKGQHVHALYVAKSGVELRDVRDVFGVVAPSRRQHVAKPDRPLARGQPAREVERRADLLSREMQVAQLAPGLDVEQHEVYLLQLLVREAFAEVAVGVERGVYARLLRG